MIETLKAFNFGKDFINWIETIYHKPTCVNKNNGYFSENVDITRGIRQGCAISAMIFILVVEILVLRIKQNKNIKGMVENCDSEIILSQYADDMSLFLENENSIVPSLQII